MLTVDFDRFPVAPGDRVLDMGCGGGRHAFALYRRGADVTAFDMDAAELKDVAAMFAAMKEAGEVPLGAQARTVRGTAYDLPFADASFDRIIAAEVLEHLPQDDRAMRELFRVLKPGGRIAVTVPRWGPELVCWALSSRYHEVDGGHVRIYRGDELRRRLTAAGLTPEDAHHTHALHAPYWWLKCAVGVDDADSRLVQAYHRLLVWDMMKAPKVTRLLERLLNPVVGKSLVVYLRKPEASVPLRDLPGVLSAHQLDRTVAAIAAAQQPSGALPWPDGHTDPWDHVECAMALTLGDRLDEARAAYGWMRRMQEPDGVWRMKYDSERVLDASVDTNQCAYVAVGVWQWWTVTGDRRLVDAMWPHVRRALDFVLDLQAPGGHLHWSRSPEGLIDPDALVTGSSSAYQALRCGLALADLVAEPQPEWELAAGLLQHAVAHHPEVFLDKSRFSMDWYYPVLGGAVRGEPARERLAERWDEFVVPGVGARCVADRPWVTGAETAELVLTLAAIGDAERGRRLLGEVQHLREADGSYWTGLVFDENVRWPVERSSWTSAAVVLAADALSGGPTLALFAGDGLPTGVLLPDGACTARCASRA